MSIAAPKLLFPRVRTIWDRRAVLFRIIGGDLKVKYEGSTLGYVWSILEPLMLTAVYFVVFTYVFPRSRGTSPFPLFLISGILPWQWFTETVSLSLRSLRGNASLITKVHVAREIFPLSAIGGRAVEFVLSLGVLAVIAGIYTHAPSWYLLAFPLAVLLQAMLLLGIGMILAPASTLLRDIEHVIRPVIRAMFYLTPILYPLHEVIGADSRFPGWAQQLYRFNPMVGILDLYRAVWFPDLFEGWQNVGISAGVSSIILLFGWRFFARLEPAVLKEL